MQAQRRPAMGIRRRGACFCPVAAAPYRAYELRQMSRKRRPAQAQRRPAMGIRRRGACFCPVAAAPYRAYELRQMSRKLGRRKRSAARQWASGAEAPVFCPVAAAPYRAYELRQMSRKGRPAQAQRRPAMNIRCRALVFARWRLRLTGPTNCDKCHGNVGRRKRSAARQWASGAGRLFCPVAAAPYRAYELRQMSRKGRPAQAQRRPAMNIRRRGACFCPVAAAPYRAYELRQMSRKGRPVQAQRRPAMGIRRRAPVLPGGGCALPGLRTATNVTET
ncbi:hypothetical protein IE990_19605 [Klebsiella pneumoniae]|uniref:Uncharacterized protein n=1 Tax=Klebsiella pneumoniae TaxID=573 RepID=A0A927DFF6_KLEPN|nr:hypothetical protein [Klebsiella pneumoniae]